MRRNVWSVDEIESVIEATRQAAQAALDAPDVQSQQEREQGAAYQAGIDSACNAVLLAVGAKGRRR